MNTLIQPNIIDGRRFARSSYLRLLACASLTACGGGTDVSAPPKTATAALPANMMLAVQTETVTGTAKALPGQAAAPGTTTTMAVTEAGIPKLKYGSTYHIKNNYSGAPGTYLDTRSAGCKDNWLCVSTASSNDRHNGSGSWTLLSASGKNVGDEVKGGDLVHLANKYPYKTSPDLGSGDFGGFLDVRGDGCEGNVLCVSTSASRNRDSGSGTWKIEGNGETIYAEQSLQLSNQYRGRIGTYLDTRWWGCMDNVICVSTASSPNRDSGSGSWRFEQPATDVGDVNLNGSSGTIRHIYNMTYQTWYFAIQPSTGNIKTNCPGARTRGDGLIECMIPPKTTFSLAYIIFGNPVSAPSGRITLQSPDKAVQSWTYGTDFFRSSFYISHSGRTTGVNLNEPADGDIQIYANMGG